ncbi:hypothetical protein RB5271 [Rhodopirellula baltica SH 1]|uniref:Uncharacterized protein n=1 Tax=Rhodopirellula baltica (strain DSM 10527 / NCIMB 13988 / SH1) TaxID=243090 RepID=Q7UGE4_RHOBA|nr:hypothetical protein RB5271 [Rhodopirellula baltica SH 1]
MTTLQWKLPGGNFRLIDLVHRNGPLRGVKSVDSLLNCKGCSRRTPPFPTSQRVCSQTQACQHCSPPLNSHDAKLDPFLTDLLPPTRCGT